MSSDENVKQIVAAVEKSVEVIYSLNFFKSDKAPAPELFKAEMLAKIARQLKSRAIQVDMHRLNIDD